MSRNCKALMAFNHDIDMIDYEKSKEFCSNYRYVTLLITIYTIFVSLLELEIEAILVTNTMKDARYPSCGRKALQFLDMAIAKY
jgi:hypothetical protein